MVPRLVLVLLLPLLSGCCGCLWGREAAREDAVEGVTQRRAWVLASSGRRLVAEEGPAGGVVTLEEEGDPEAILYFDRVREEPTDDGMARVYRRASTGEEVWVTRDRVRIRTDARELDAGLR